MCNSMHLQFPPAGAQFPPAPSSSDVCSNAMVVPRFSLGKTFRQENSSLPKEEIEVLSQYSAGKALRQEESVVVSDHDSTGEAKEEMTIESLRKDQDLSGSKLPFLWKLHILLDDVEASGNDHIVSWLEHGRSFKVYRPKSFISLIAPHYFKQSKYKSFQRQLHLYEFTRMQYGPEAGSYSHPLFLRGQPTLCLSLSPIKIKGKAGRQSVKKMTAKASLSHGKVLPQQQSAFPGKVAQSSVRSAVLSKREQDEWVAKIHRMVVQGSTLAAELKQPQTQSEPEQVLSQHNEAMCEDKCCLFGANFHLLPEQHDIDSCACCYESDNEENDDIAQLLRDIE